MMLRAILRGIEPDSIYPSFDILEKSGILNDVNPRFSKKTGRLLGIEYRRSAVDPYREIIVFDPKTKQLGFTRNKKNLVRLGDFKNILKHSREQYKQFNNGIIDTEMKWDSFFEGLNFDTNTEAGLIKIEKTKDEIRAELKQGFFPKLKKI